MEGRDRLKSTRISRKSGGVKGIAQSVTALGGRASGPKVTLVLGVRLLGAIGIDAGADGKVIKVVLPKVTVPPRVFPAQTEEIVHDILEVEGAIARPELKNLRQKATQVTKDRKYLRGIIRVLKKIEPF